MIYEKLVRDNIPEIIERNGFTPETKVLSKREIQNALIEKLKEELTELTESKGGIDRVCECADMIEVLIRISELNGFTETELERIRIDKGITNGKFDKNIFLVDVL